MSPDDHNTVGPGTGPWLTTSEAAQRLGLQPTSLRTAITRGHLAADRLDASRFYLVRVEEVERYRREHLGQRSWQHRRDPHYEPSPAARASQRYRARTKARAQQDHGAEHR